MNLLRTLSMAAVGLTAASLAGCISAPDYPITPQISVNGITVIRRDGAIGFRDSVEVALNFQDGDGDLGLSDGDTTGVFAYKRGTNRFNNNYFIKPFYKNNAGVFVPLPSFFTYNGRFPRLTTDTRPGPLKGVLRHAIVFSLINLSTQPGTEIRFQVSIADRALHESNVVTTESVRL